MTRRARTGTSRRAMTEHAARGTGCAADHEVPVRRALAAADDRGAALVEFAVIIGVLIYLILGVVSFGVLLAVRHGLDEAAGEAARAAAISFDDPSTLEDERIETAEVSLASSGVECPPGPVTCDVRIEPCAGDARDCVTVELVHDRSIDAIVGRIPILEAVLPDTIEASATAMVNP
jgi:hypothetical protein